MLSNVESDATFFRIKLKKILQDKKKISRNNLAANSIPKTDLNLLSEDKINFHCSARINLNFYNNLELWTKVLKFEQPDLMLHYNIFVIQIFVTLRY